MISDNIELIISTPKETDMATFEGTSEIVRRISKAVGGILPIVSKNNNKSYGQNKRHMNKTSKEIAIEFLKPV